MFDEYVPIFSMEVAHEINRPLAKIGENACLLLDEATQEPNPHRQNIAQQLCTNVDSLKKVSGDLLRYSQVNVKPEPDQKQTINMKVLLESVFKDFDSRLKAKSITLKNLARPVEIYGIHDQLRTIVEQLLANAIKYSPEGGEIRIMLRDSETQMELEIEDEGPGIDPDDRAYVFEPFFRGKTLLSGESDEGPGMGLAIVKEYVANHQGKVDIIDTRQDQQGVRILIQIPLTEEP